MNFVRNYFIIGNLFCVKINHVYALLNQNWKKIIRTTVKLIHYQQMILMMIDVYVVIVHVIVKNVQELINLLIFIHNLPWNV